MAAIEGSTKVQALLKELAAYSGDRQKSAALVRRFATHDGPFSDAGLATIIEKIGIEKVSDAIQQLFGGDDDNRK